MNRIILAIFVINVCLFTSANAWTYSGGTGTSDNPYLIATSADLNSIGFNSSDWNKSFKLISDINMSAS
ncbi:MAG: hypothetical protein ABFD79_15080, partial [Phycisphaerales bacterium]